MSLGAYFIDSSSVPGVKNQPSRCVVGERFGTAAVIVERRLEGDSVGGVIHLAQAVAVVGHRQIVDHSFGHAVGQKSLADYGGDRRVEVIAVGCVISV